MRRQGGKLLPCAVLALCLAALGTGYAYWDGTLRVAGKLATGQLDCAFASEGTYRAVLVRDGGEVLAEVPMEASAGENEKSIALVFPEGMPEDFLGGENYLRISCPIAEKGMKAKEKPVDFTVPGEEIPLTPEQVYLALPNAVYDWDEPDAGFLEPKRLIAFRSVERLDDVLCCCLYLRAENEKPEGGYAGFHPGGRGESHGPAACRAVVSEQRCLGRLFLCDGVAHRSADSGQRETNSLVRGADNVCLLDGLLAYEGQCGISLPGGRSASRGRRVSGGRRRNR